MPHQVEVAAGPFIAEAGTPAEAVDAQRRARGQPLIRDQNLGANFEVDEIQIHHHVRVEVELRPLERSVERRANVYGLLRRVCGVRVGEPELELSTYLHQPRGGV